MQHTVEDRIGMTVFVIAAGIVGRRVEAVRTGNQIDDQTVLSLFRLLAFHGMLPRR